MCVSRFPSIVVSVSSFSSAYFILLFDNPLLSHCGKLRQNCRSWGNSSFLHDETFTSNQFTCLHYLFTIVNAFVAAAGRSNR